MPPPRIKTPNSLGSVYQRTDGRWVAALSLGSKRLARYAATRKEALALLQELLGDQRAGLLAEPTSTTVGAFLDSWIETVEPDLKPSTRARYRQLVARYLKPTLGHVRLQRLQPVHILAAVAQWRTTSPGSAPHAYRALHRALALATKWGLLARNPCDQVDHPRSPHKEPTIWTIDQARTFLSATEPDRWYPLWGFLAGTGARLGEALGLEWPDVDLDHGTAALRRSLVWVEGTPILQQSLKTRSSRRTLSLPSFVAAELRQWKVRQAEDRLAAGPAWKDERRAIFTTSSGTPPSPGNLRCSFRRGCKRAGVPPCRLHDLRHLAATTMVAGGVDPKAVQARLGHSSLTMTLGLYSHVVPSGDRQAALALERALGNRR